eukprot:jgi/Chlat1/4290/Chrsp29S04379
MDVHTVEVPGPTGCGAPCPRWQLIAISVVFAGVQFGWALQLSLLTPYVQELGLPHFWSSFIWLCGPISGLLVQPYVGAWSDRCRTKWGRRRPFVAVGAVLVAVAVILIGNASDLGRLLGDGLDGSTPRAILVFVLGFWLLDIANNTIAGPCRALVADLAGATQREEANAYTAMWLSIGNFLGYGAGAIGQWHAWLPFLQTEACGRACADLKGAFFCAVLFLAICTAVTLIVAKETLPGDSPEDVESTALSCQSKEVCFSALSSTGAAKRRCCSDTIAAVDGIMQLPESMRRLMVVQALSWLGWFSFFLYNTDWMARDVYGGLPQALNGTPSATLDTYNNGVRAGSFGLLLKSAVSAVVSPFVKPLCERFGATRTWAFGNAWRGILLAATTVVVAAAQPPNTADKGAAIALIALLGIAWSISMSVPYALTAQYTTASGGGQGLAMGVMNLAIVVPQVVVALGSGPLDSMFGGSNEPAFVAGAVVSFISAWAAVRLLPRPVVSYAALHDTVEMQQQQLPPTLRSGHAGIVAEGETAHAEGPYYEIDLDGSGKGSARRGERQPFL